MPLPSHFSSQIKVPSQSPHLIAHPPPLLSTESPWSPTSTTTTSPSPPSPRPDYPSSPTYDFGSRRTLLALPFLTVGSERGAVPMGSMGSACSTQNEAPLPTGRAKGGLWDTWNTQNHSWDVCCSSGPCWDLPRNLSLHILLKMEGWLSADPGACGQPQPGAR